MSPLKSSYHYVDANAAGPVSEIALRAYATAATAAWADPSSSHALGHLAAEHLAASRRQVAAALAVTANEVVFVSGGTEANALAIMGTLAGHDGAHAICSCIEHPSVMRAFELAAHRFGIRVSHVPVSRAGRIEVADLEGLVGDDTRLVSVLTASNETGVVQPIEALAAFCRSRQITFHTDAAQAVGRLRLAPAAWDVDLISLSGHKFGALPGTAALVVRRDTAVRPLLAGGGQQGGRRAGTDDVAGAAAFAAALTERCDRLATCARDLASQRDAFERAVCDRIAGVEVIGSGSERLCNTSALRFVGCEAEGLLMALDLRGIAVSTGSACSSGAIEPSPALLAMGYTRAEARQVVRYSWPFERSTSRVEVDHVVAALELAVARMRASDDRQAPRSRSLVPP